MRQLKVVTFLTVATALFVTLFVMWGSFLIYVLFWLAYILSFGRINVLHPLFIVLGLILLLIDVGLFFRSLDGIDKSVP